MDHAHKFAIVIPARNEERAIARIINELPKANVAIFVVDDCSTDNTAELAAQSGATVIKNSVQQGYSASVLAGFSRALKADVAHIVTLDGDGAHDPSDIPKLMLTHYTNSSALTVGDRFLSPGLKRNSTKHLANSIVYPLLQCASAVSLPIGDYASGLRIYSEHYARQLLNFDLKSRPFGLCYISILKAIELGESVKFSPCSVRYDASELLHTKRKEFIDFVSTARSLSEMPYFEQLSAKLSSALTQQHNIRFETENAVIYAIYLAAVDGYIFQIQDPFYDAFDNSGTSITIKLQHT